MSKIIFTDLDGTLTLEDTYLKFLLFNVKPLQILKNIPLLTSMLLKYLFKKIGDDDVKMITFHLVFNNYDREQNIQKFIDSISWNPQVMEQIEKKRKEGYKVIIVTASPDVYVREICNYLSYDGFISTKTVDNGRYLNGTFDGKICNFEEKPKRIKKFLDGEKLTHTLSYGNSLGDFAMLKFCDESYFVNKLDIKRFEK